MIGLQGPFPSYWTIPLCASSALRDGSKKAPARSPESLERRRNTSGEKQDDGLVQLMSDAESHAKGHEQRQQDITTAQYLVPSYCTRHTLMDTTEMPLVNSSELG